MDIKEVYTTNTYEATYYIMQGAQFISAESYPVNKNSVNKTGYTMEWTICLINVSDEAVEKYKSGTAEVNINDFEYTRRKLKYAIKRHLFKKAQLRKGKKFNKRSYNDISFLVNKVCAVVKRK